MLEATLGDRNRTDRQGNRIHPHTYWSERKRLTEELAQVNADLRALNLKIKAKRQELHLSRSAADAQLPLDAPLPTVLEALLHITRRFAGDLSADGYEIDRSEQAVIDLAAARLRQVKDGASKGRIQKGKP